jgi:hypothetical protein
MIPHEIPVRHPYRDNSYIARVTGNHSTSTGPISRAAIRTQVLVFNTLVPG